MDHIRIKTAEPRDVVHSELHGQFLEHLGCCINGGLWVGEDSDIPNCAGIRSEALKALQRLAPPLVRWPGGCFADTYHWRNGIGPREQRPITYNPVFGTAAIEQNGFGTHEFMDLCEQIGASPWLNVNMMTGSVAEMVEWVEYSNQTQPTTLALERSENGSPKPFNVSFWGIGNESWSGGGNYTAQGYAAEYRKYATAYSGFEQPDFNKFADFKRKTTLIAVGPDGNKPQERVAWTRDLFKALAEYRQPPMDALDLHFYNWNIEHPEDTVTDFSSDDWYRVLAGAMEIEAVIGEQYDLIQEGLAGYPKTEGPFAMTRDCQLIIGEWGNWHRMDPSAPSALWQQSTMRDALTSAITLDIFHRNCDKLRAACVAQTVNVLNALILTDGDATILTPTYHVFDLYRVHRNSRKLPVEVQAKPLDHGVPSVFGFASIKDDIIHVNVINSDDTSCCQVKLEFDQSVDFVSSRALYSDRPTDFNSAQSPDRVKIRDGRPPVGRNGAWVADLPAASVSVYQFKA